MEEVNRVGDEDTVLVDKLAATARGSSLSRQLALEADLVGVLIVSEDLTTLSSLESLLEHASPYKCRAFLAPSHKVALEMLDDLPRSIHIVLCELSGDHTYEFAAHLDQSDKYPVLCGVGVLSSGTMVRTPEPTESFLALRIPETQAQVNHMVAQLLNNTGDTTSLLHSSHWSHPSGPKKTLVRHRLVNTQRAFDALWVSRLCFHARKTVNLSEPAEQATKESAKQAL